VGSAAARIEACGKPGLPELQYLLTITRQLSHDSTFTWRSAMSARISRNFASQYPAEMPGPRTPKFPQIPGNRAIENRKIEKSAEVARRPSRDQGIQRKRSGVENEIAAVLATELIHLVGQEPVTLPEGGLVTRSPNSNTFWITGRPGYSDFGIDVQSELLFRGIGNGAVPTAELNANPRNEVLFAAVNVCSQLKGMRMG
jgi:hypothetical protein